MGSVCNSRQCGESFSIHCHMKMLKKDFIIVLKYCEAQARVRQGSARIGKGWQGMALEAKGLKA